MFALYGKLKPLVAKHAAAYLFDVMFNKVSINLIYLTTSPIFFWQIATRMEVSFKQTLFVCL